MTVRLGLLFPTRGADTDDFVDLAARVAPPVALEVLDLPWPAGTEELASLDTPALLAAVRALGSSEHLESQVPLALANRDVDVLAFAVTSSSFVHGTQGVPRRTRRPMPCCCQRQPCTPPP